MLTKGATACAPLPPATTPRRFGSIDGHIIFVCLLCFMPLTTSAQNVGLVTDAQNDLAVVFDTSGAERGTVDMPGAGSLGDCVISVENNVAFAADFASQIWVVDLSDPPQLATGSNPIAISNTGWDIALSPGGDYLAICGDPGLVSLVDSSTRVEIDTFDLGHGCNGIDICVDGSVLISYADLFTNTFAIRRLLLSETGEFSDTGDSVSLEAYNVECNPAGPTALLTGYVQVLSMQLNGLSVLDSISVAPGNPITCRMNAAGSRVFIRTTSDVLTYVVDPNTGVFGTTPVATIPGTGNNYFGGIDTLSHDQNGSQFLVPELTGSLRFFNADTGTESPPIDHPGAQFRGVCLPPVFMVFRDGFESGDATRWDAGSSQRF